MRNERNKAPSFDGLRPASKGSSGSKRANTKFGTKHEKLLMRELERIGLKFCKNVKELPGKPDIVFDKAKVAVFCDGDFWHGRDWKQMSRKLSLGSNGAYWVQKINSNRERDVRVRRSLRKMGWRVIRLWETDITKNPAVAISRIKRKLKPLG